MNGFELFTHNILVFPTIAFTGLLLFCLLYWISSLIGMADMDTFDIELSDGLDVGDGISGDNLGFFTGLLFKFGLYGLPLVIIISILALLGWMISYLLTVITAKYFSGSIFYLIGAVILVFTFFVSAVITGKVISPFRKMSENRPKRNAKSNLGKVGVVRTSEVNERFGEVTLEDGGAGLILKVRSSDNVFKKGDKVVLLDYVEDDNIYTVISEAEFKHG